MYHGKYAPHPAGTLPQHYRSSLQRLGFSLVHPRAACCHPVGVAHRPLTWSGLAISHGASPSPIKHHDPFLGFSRESRHEPAFFDLASPEAPNPPYRRAQLFRFSNGRVSYLPPQAILISRGPDNRKNRPRGCRASHRFQYRATQNRSRACGGCQNHNPANLVSVFPCHRPWPRRC
jgi:hypothetical protein